MSAASKPEYEKRFTEVASLRAEGDGSRRIEGYAIVFGQRSLNLGGFVEFISPEAVDRTIKENIDVRAFWNHDSGEVLGRLTAGTLQMRKDKRGLKVIIDPPKWADKIIESIERGDVSGMSFGFSPIDDTWDMDGDLPIRTVTDMRVHEVSIVSMPAYPATSVSARALDVARQMRGNKLEFMAKQMKLARAR